MSEKIAVSIIVPVYNVEKYIGECVRSLKEQTFQDFEVIFIDDCSKDNSYAVLQGLINGENHFSLYKNENNLGLSNTRNRGIELAKGKYLFFLDSDDFLTPDAIKDLYFKAEENQSDVVVGKMMIYDQSIGKKFINEYAAYSGPIYLMMKKGVITPFTFVVFPTGCSKLYKAEMLRENHIKFINLLHEDNLFSLETYYASKRIDFIDRFIYIRRFRKEENSITQVFNLNRFKNKMQIYFKMLEVCLHNNDKSAFNYCLYSFGDIIKHDLPLLEPEDREHAILYIKNTLENYPELHTYKKDILSKTENMTSGKVTRSFEMLRMFFGEYKVFSFKMFHYLNKKHFKNNADMYISQMSYHE